MEKRKKEGMKITLEEETNYSISSVVIRVYI